MMKTIKYVYFFISKMYIYIIIFFNNNIKINLSDFTISGFPLLNIKGELILGKNIKINSGLKSNPVGLSSRCCFYAIGNGKIQIGENVGISNVLIHSRKSIVIENNVFLGGGCQLFDNNFHSLDPKKRMLHPDPDIRSAEILIREGVFIGANAIILKGVTIGKNSIVAAGSVVVKDIPDNQIWGGNPAQFIRDIDVLD